MRRSEFPSGSELLISISQFTSTSRPRLLMFFRRRREKLIAQACNSSRFVVEQPALHPDGGDSGQRGLSEVAREPDVPFFSRATFSALLRARSAKRMVLYLPFAIFLFVLVYPSIRSSLSVLKLKAQGSVDHYESRLVKLHEMLHGLRNDLLQSGTSKTRAVPNFSSLAEYASLRAGGDIVLPLTTPTILPRGSLVHRLLRSRPQSGSPWAALDDDT
ncbi:hypothetical protein PISMIDRAFT_16808 [Pisolithus microcarpus 441]|uniref:Uncharacterized protein n=1 Tax=Pisolithus microcarpus 441 TaxID=765257 RepID=A0A0C9YER1_9AGAM|nr:hypothetical protein BKA83DRAFT_16808 [Pisolithus microcarpus]KIK15056.1 hypothetical protein PISMIDRAFT_16808 [Pisolithus microcarpus 441]